MNKVDGSILFVVWIQRGLFNLPIWPRLCVRVRHILGKLSIGSREVVSLKSDRFLVVKHPPLTSQIQLSCFIQASHRNFVGDKDNLNNLKNSLYEPNGSVIWPSLYVQSISLWSSLFLRFQRNEKPLSESRAEIARIVEENKQSRIRVAKLKRYLHSSNQFRWSSKIFL